MIVRVKLTRRELRIAYLYGGERHTNALLANRKDTNNYGDRDLGWTDHIEGVAGEIVVAKVVRIKNWVPSVDTYRKGSDVGQFHVRCTQDTPWLIIRKQDKKKFEKEKINSIWIGVSGKAPDYIVHGWIRIADALKEIYKDDPGYRNNPAWFVPHVELHSLETLPPLDE